ncbi:hypothetical protein [Paenibacillus pabuli]|uniref:hypothetical protein n=1 Tax=Paenibacillus pabuli TaxID=1472 RepID=UPI001FFE4259|nr:hypothetical protein [Paenibacillus pabuli]UPK45417.1 hypothetical protein KET34_08100 [Paenibacillus pabuli]
MGEAPWLCRSGATTVSTAVMDAVQSREVLPHWAQHLTLTRLAIAQAARCFTFFQNNYVPKASEGRLIPHLGRRRPFFFGFGDASKQVKMPHSRLTWLDIDHTYAALYLVHNLSSFYQLVCLWLPSSLYKFF